MMNVTAIDQILLHENFDRIYRKTRWILLLELSLIFTLFTGLYCYCNYILPEGISAIVNTAGYLDFFKCHYRYSVHTYYANPQAQVSKS